MKVGNNIDFVPETTNVDLLYYNKTLFQKAGLNPNDPPTTIAQLDADAAKLTVYQGKTLKQIGFIPWLDGGALSDEPFLWGWVFGANYYNASTHQLDLDSPQLVKMFDWMGTYAKKYGASALDSFSSGFGGAFTPTDGFYSGKVAMVIHGNWYQEAIHEYAPKLNFGVAPIPYPPGGRKDASTFNTNLYFLPKNGVDPSSDVEAVKYTIFATSGRILASDVNEWMSIPVHKTTKDIKFYKNGKIDNPIFKVVMEVADSPNSGTPALTNVATELGTDLANIQDDVIYHNESPGPLLKALQAKLQPQVQK
jgi:ABC-type glycerol-3-phosphate transport system substrate-binding protein